MKRSFGVVGKWVSLLDVDVLDVYRFDPTCPRNMVVLLVLLVLKEVMGPIAEGFRIALGEYVL